MKNLEMFLKENPDLIRENKQVSTNNTLDNKDEIKLYVLLSFVSDDNVYFYHLGKKMFIKSSDVISVADTQKHVFNPTKTGKPVELTVKYFSEIYPDAPVVPLQLLDKYPFAISQPSLADNITIPRYTPNELEWLAKNNLNEESLGDTNTNSGTYCGHNTTSPKWSGTISGNKEDDGKSDEYYGDDATHDDTGSDD